MHAGMQYDLIRGPGQGHEPLKSRKIGHVQRLSPPPFTMGAGKRPRILKLEGQYLKLVDFCPSFCVM